MYRDIPEELRALIEPVVEDSGLELVDATITRGRPPWLLRITIDTPEGDGRVPVERCAAVSREVETHLDAADAMLRFLSRSREILGTWRPDAGLVFYNPADHSRFITWMGARSVLEPYRRRLRHDDADQAISLIYRALTSEGVPQMPMASTISSLTLSAISAQRPSLDMRFSSGWMSPHP